MMIEHQGKRPRVHDSAYVAPTAVLCGDVTVGENARVLFGAVVVAEGGPVEIGADSIVMENTVVRGTARHPTSIGDHVLIGPHAHLTGCTIEDRAFVATGAAVFNGARVCRGASVAIGGIVHIKTVLPEGARVPIGWTAVGDPAEILPPEEDDRRREVMAPLDFPRTVFGVERAPMGEMMPEVTRRYARSLGRHRNDVILDGG